MSEDLSHIRVLVPPDVEDAGNLPLGVLDAMSNKLGCDIIEAVKGKVPGKRYAAWAELAYQWARIAGVVKPDRETYRGYSVSEVTHALGWDQVDEDDDEVDPTPPVDEQQKSTDEDYSDSSGSQ